MALNLGIRLFALEPVTVNLEIKKRPGISFFNKLYFRVPQAPKSSYSKHHRSPFFTLNKNPHTNA